MLRHRAGKCFLWQRKPSFLGCERFQHASRVAKAVEDFRLAHRPLPGLHVQADICSHARVKRLLGNFKDPVAGAWASPGSAFHSFGFLRAVINASLATETRSVCIPF